MIWKKLSFWFRGPRPKPDLSLAYASPEARSLFLILEAANTPRETM